MSAVVLSAFGVESAARVTGLSTTQLARWDREGWFSPSLTEADRRRADGRLYSFADLVNLRTVRALIERGVRLQRLRKAWVYLRTLGLPEISAAKLYVAAGHVYFHHEEALVAASRSGQSAMPEVVTVAPIAAEVRAGIRALSERTPEQVGATERSRRVVNGEEVFAGTRIPVATIAAHLRNGWPRTEILDEYPRLRDEDIDLAEARVQAPLAAAS